MDNFGQVLIRALETGRESKRRKLRDEWEQEDRDIEKQLLQHRLREMKIQESLQKRGLGAENFKFLQGLPEANIPEQMREPMDDPNAIATIPETIQERYRFTPQEIPGVPELGVAPMSLRPETAEQSMERQLADFTAKKRIETLWTPYNLADGAQRVLGGQVIAENPRDPRPTAPRNPIAITNRGADGIEKTEYVDPQEAVGMTTTRHPLPLRGRAGSGAGGQGADVEIEDFVEGIATGKIPTSSIPKSALGVRINGALQQRGFNVRAADADERAMRTFYTNLNDNDINRLRITMASTTEALDQLETLAGEWKGTGGIFSSAALALAKNGRYGPEMKQKASDIEETIRNITQGLAAVGNNGAPATNAQLESAAKTLQSNWSEGTMKTAINSLRKGLTIRSGAIEGLQPITPGNTRPLVNPPNETATTDDTGNAPGRRGAIPDGAAPGVAQHGALTDAAITAALQKSGYDTSKITPEFIAKVRKDSRALQIIGLGPK